MSEQLGTPHEDPRLRVGPIWVDPRSAIYATIIMITAIKASASRMVGW